LGKHSYERKAAVQSETSQRAAASQRATPVGSRGGATANRKTTPITVEL